MRNVFILTALMLAATPASAAFYSTQYLKQLMDSCNKLPETFEASTESFSRVKDCGLSTGYILGVVDALNIMADGSICLPRTLPSEQAVLAVDRWIQKNPERLPYPADQSVRSALADNWSCSD